MTDRICTYCGQHGHRAHACKRRQIVGAKWDLVMLATAAVALLGAVVGVI